MDMKDTNNVFGQYAVVLGCMSNNGARAKSLGRVDDLATARARFKAATWEPLGFGREWSRTVALIKITGPALNPTRETIERRDLD